MSEEAKELDGAIKLEFDLGDPPQKVWRAITIPELRERWLPEEILAVPDAIAVTPDQRVSYRLRDDRPPFLRKHRDIHDYPERGRWDLPSDRP